MERSDLCVSSTYQSEYGLTTTTEFQRTSSSNSNPVLTQHVGDTGRNRHNWSLWSQHRVSEPTHTATSPPHHTHYCGCQHATCPYSATYLLLGIDPDNDRDLKRVGT